MNAINTQLSAKDLEIKLYAHPKTISDQRELIYLDKTYASDFLYLDSGLRRNDEDRILASSPPERQKKQMSLSTEKTNRLLDKLDS